MEEQMEYALLYPNPAGNSVKLDYMAYTEGLAAFTLYNNMGAVVLKSDMQAGQNSATFDISRLSAGIYYWRLNDSGRTIKTGKLSIAR
jgi:hypothetical protein